MYLYNTGQQLHAKQEEDVLCLRLLRKQKASKKYVIADTDPRCDGWV